MLSAVSGYGEEPPPGSGHHAGGVPEQTNRVHALLLVEHSRHLTVCRPHLVLLQTSALPFVVVIVNKSLGFYSFLFTDRYPHELLCIMQTPSTAMLWTRYTLRIPFYILSAATEGDYSFSFRTTKTSMFTKHKPNGTP